MTPRKKKMEELFKQYEAIRLLAETEARELTAKDREDRAALKAQINTLCAAEDEDKEERELRAQLYGTSKGPLTLLDGVGAGTDSQRASGNKFPGRCYRDLFGNSLSNDGWRGRGEFWTAAQSGKYHPNLRGLTVGSPSDGGFLIPTEYAADIHDVALENEIVFPRCMVEPMMSNEKKVPATAIGSHFQNLYGNMVAYWTAEAGNLTDKTPKFRQMTLKAQKLTILFKYSSEWKEDTPNSEKKLGTLAGNGLGWYRDLALIKGSGAGEPLGILKANCTIEVAKIPTQAAKTLIYANLASMLGRLHPACFNNSIWIFHISVIPQLLQLTIPCGTGGSVYPVLSESNGTWRVLTRPVIFTEKTETLGSKGDVILADLSQYICGMRGDSFRFETTNGPGFTTDEIYARMIARLDGQPLWDAPLTLEDGSTTVSPFCVLGAR